MLYSSQKEKLNVLFITHYAQLYGANRSLVDLLFGLKNFPILPIVLIPNSGPMIDVLRQNSIKYYVIPFQMGVAYRWKSTNIFKQKIRDVQYYYKGILKLLANQKSLNEVVSVIKKESIDVLYSNSSVITIGHILSRRLNIPQIYHVRELIVKQFSLYPDFGMKYYKKIVPKSTYQIFISNFAKENSITGELSNKSRIIYDGIQIPQFNNARSNDYPIKIGIIGYISRQKNQLELIDALKNIPCLKKIKVYVIGGGDIDNLKKECQVNNLQDYVIFTGFKENIDYYFREVLDIVVVSAINEALGRVTMEAMAHGLLVIGKNSGATAELIDDQKTGLLYDSKDDLVYRICKMVDDKDLRLQIGKNAYLKAKTEFNINLYSKKIFEIIKSATRQIPYLF